jgi:predicted TIM-barrel fold metal-dependent hydrolase
MRIDSHQHVFWHGRDSAGLIADMDEHQIDQAWLLSWEILPHEDESGYHGVLNPLHLRADGTHAGIPLSDLIRTRDAYPDRFILGYCPHPQHVTAPKLFAAAVKIHGVRVCGEWKFRMCFDDPRCLEVYRVAGELGCPVVLHLDAPYLIDVATGKMRYQPSWYGGTIDNLERALDACPETVFIGHAPGFWREISGDCAADPNAYPSGPITPDGRLHGLFERHSNLCADLSAGSALRALKRDPAHAREFLIRFADRLLFGRDYYGGELLDFLATLTLPIEVQERIFYKNALRLAPPSEGGSL